MITTEPALGTAPVQHYAEGPDGWARTALISSDGVYRYELTRAWGDGPAVLFAMLNPSVADHEEDDRTLSRCVNFAKREGFGMLRVVNLFALRATYPTELAAHKSPVGPWNDRIVEGAALLSDAVVCGWGADKAVTSARVRRFVELVGAWHNQLHCLGTTKDGHPRHPLYLPGDTPMVPWSPPA